MKLIIKHARLDILHIQNTNRHKHTHFLSNTYNLQFLIFHVHIYYAQTLNNPIIMFKFMSYNGYVVGSLKKIYRKCQHQRKCNTRCTRSSLPIEKSQILSSNSFFYSLHLVLFISTKLFPLYCIVFARLHRNFVVVFVASFGENFGSDNKSCMH